MDQNLRESRKRPQLNGISIFCINSNSEKVTTIPAKLHTAKIRPVQPMLKHEIRDFNRQIQNTAGCFIGLAVRR